MVNAEPVGRETTLDLVVVYLQSDVASQFGRSDLRRDGVGIGIVSHVGVGGWQVDTPLLGQIPFHLLAVLFQQDSFVHDELGHFAIRTLAAVGHGPERNLLWRRVVVMAVYAVLAQDAVHPNPNLGSYVLVVGPAGLVGSHEHVKSGVAANPAGINPCVEMMSGYLVAMVPEKPIVAGCNYPFVVSARVAGYSEGGIAERKEVGFEVLGRVSAVVRVLDHLVAVGSFH